MEKPTVSLQPSEAAVVSAAATIYAAYVTSGRVREGEERRWMEQAIRDAIYIARKTDDSIRSDGEMT